MYTHLKVTNVSDVGTLFLTHHLFFKGAVYGCELKNQSLKKFTVKFNKIGMSLLPIPPCVSDYITCIQALIFKHKYITGDYMVTSSDLFFN